jgi:hypothetical protein
MTTARIKNLMFAVTVISITGCSSYRNVTTTFDRSIDFSQYRTFAWTPDSLRDESKIPDDKAYDNDIIRNNAKNYITNNLTKRGMVVNVDSPDVVFHLTLLNEKREKIITYYNRPYVQYYYYSPFYFPYYYPYYRFYTWYSWSYPPFWTEETTYVKTYVRGTIILKMYDAKLKTLVWIGSAEGDIYDPSYIHYDVHPAINAIMKQFPVKEVRRKSSDVKTRSPIVRTEPVNGGFSNRYSAH